MHISAPEGSEFAPVEVCVSVRCSPAASQMKALARDLEDQQAQELPSPRGAGDSVCHRHGSVPRGVKTPTDVALCGQEREVVAARVLEPWSPISRAGLGRSLVTLQAAGAEGVHGPVGGD